MASASPFEAIEAAYLSAVRDELATAKDWLRGHGLTVETRLSVRSDVPDSYTSEISLEVIDATGDLVDMLEFFVLECGVAPATIDEVREWLREQLRDL